MLHVLVPPAAPGIEFAQVTGPNALAQTSTCAFPALPFASFVSTFRSGSAPLVPGAALPALNEQLVIESIVASRTYSAIEEPSVAVAAVVERSGDTTSKPSNLVSMTIAFAKTAGVVGASIFACAVVRVQASGSEQSKYP